MTLQRGHEGSSAASSFVAGGGADAAEGISVMPLDEIVAELHLERVDFVKMDIEGAERFGLQGALMTLRDFRPRMAISSYHLRGDERALLALARAVQPAYRVHAKNVETQDRWVRSKVLFFE